MDAHVGLKTTSPRRKKPIELMLLAISDKIISVLLFRFLLGQDVVLSYAFFFHYYRLSYKYCTVFFLLRVNHLLRSLRYQYF